jgi:hypothetical protein
MFELFSAVPSAIVVLLSLRKQISVLDEMLVSTRRKGKAGPRPGMPVQWILSPGRPTRTLQKLGRAGEKLSDLVVAQVQEAHGTCRRRRSSNTKI